MNVFLDVDEVVCNFMHGIEIIYPELKKRDVTKYELPKIVDWETIYSNTNFWLNLPVLDKPTFQVSGYLSHRLFDIATTKAWLLLNEFEDTDVLHVPSSSHKVEVLLSYRCDLYVDDKPETFLQCQQAGINVFLYDQPWNRHIKTSKRIHKLKELETICK